jgi:hypothetical protein
MRDIRNEFNYWLRQKLTIKITVEKTNYLLYILRYKKISHKSQAHNLLAYTDIYFILLKNLLKFIIKKRSYMMIAYSKHVCTFLRENMCILDHL